MPRAHYDIIPESDTEIIEEVTYRQKTKWGMTLKTTRTVLKVPTPAKAKAASGSQSKSKKKVQAFEVEEEPQIQVDNNDVQTYEVVSDLEYQLEDNMHNAELLATMCPSYSLFINSNIHKSPMEQWLSRWRKYLNWLLEMEGHNLSPKCSICSRSSGYIKCSDCFRGNMFCKACCLQHHSRSPFHRLLQWNGKHYVSTSLNSLGFILFLGHSGDPCPKTVEV
jgi:hypothetical protein